MSVLSTIVHLSSSPIPLQPLVLPSSRLSRSRATRLSIRAARYDLPTNPFQTSHVNLTVVGTDGKKKRLSELTEGKTVVAFLRHFGCPLCFEQGHTLMLQQPLLERSGYKLIMIGVGDEGGALKFAERQNLPLDAVYGDPTRATYSALNLSFGLDKTFGSFATPLSLLKRGVEGLKEGTKNYVPIPPSSPDAVLQQGGCYVFDGGVCHFAWRDEGTGDHAPLTDLLDACCGAVNPI